MVIQIQMWSGTWRYIQSKVNLYFDSRINAPYTTFLDSVFVSTFPFWPEEFNTTVSEKVYQWLAEGWRFSPGTPVSFSNKAVKLTSTNIPVATILLNM
jgi:hypothetical protein